MKVLLGKTLGLHALLVVGILLTVGCKKEFNNQKPTPPDMSALVQAYQQPSGNFDAQAVDSITNYLEMNLERLLALGLKEAMIDELTDAVREGDLAPTDAKLAVPPGVGVQSLEGQGFLEVARICNGLKDPKEADLAANGKLDLVVNFTERGVDPVAWAYLKDCVYMVDGLPVKMGAGTQSGIGDIRIFVGNNITVDRMGLEPLILDIDITVAFGTDPAIPLRLDTRYVPQTKQFELRIPLAQGDIIAVTSGKDLVGVRAANGDFDCDVVGRVCKNATGTTVTF
jgi:hypothetical protein